MSVDLVVVFFSSLLERAGMHDETVLTSFKIAKFLVSRRVWYLVFHHHLSSLCSIVLIFSLAGRLLLLGGLSIN
jgi:energy-converting hydrogenase Eha subunit H